MVCVIPLPRFEGFCCCFWSAKTSCVLPQNSCVGQILAEPVECLRPAFRSAARCVGFERICLPHGESRPALLIRKRNCGPDLVARLVVDDPLEYDALRLNDLEVRALKWIVLAVRPAHHEPKFASRAEIHLAGRQGETSGPPPLLHVFRLGPRLEDKLARRIEYALDRHLAFLRPPRAARLAHHRSPVLLASVFR